MKTVCVMLVLTSLTVFGDINIPDENFRSFCLANYDLDSSGGISEEEALAVTIMNCSSLDIADMTGITYFDNLVQLRCFRNLLTSLSIPNLGGLKYLDCGLNMLTSLDVTRAASLEVLRLDSNNFTTLTVSGLPKLQQLDFMDNPNMTFFDCHSNDLHSLDFTGVTSLRTLVCGDNQLEVIDVRPLAGLSSLPSTAATTPSQHYMSVVFQSLGISLVTEASSPLSTLTG